MFRTITGNGCLLFYFTQIMNADSKLKEMHKLMTSVNEWVDDCLGLMAEYKEDMETEDLENFKKRAEVDKFTDFFFILANNQKKKKRKHTWYVINM